MYNQATVYTCIYASRPKHNQSKIQQSGSLSQYLENALIPIEILKLEKNTDFI